VLRQLILQADSAPSSVKEQSQGVAGPVAQDPLFAALLKSTPSSVGISAFTGTKAQRDAKGSVSRRLQNTKKTRRKKRSFEASRMARLEGRGEGN